MRKLYEKCLSQTQFSVLNFEQIFQLSQKRLKRELKAELIANGYTVQNRKAFYMQRVRSLSCWSHIWTPFTMTRRKRSAILRTELS